MINLLQDIGLIVFEMICCKMFYEIFAKKRYNDIMTFVIMALMSCGSLVVVYVFADYFVAKQVVMAVVFTGFMFWNFEISIKKSFVLSLIYLGLLLVVDCLSFSVNSKFFAVDEVGEAYYMQSAFIVVLGKVFLFLCILLIRKIFWQKNANLLGDRQWLKFLIFPCFTIAIIAAMLWVFGYVETSRQANVLFVIAFGMAGMNIYVFYLMNDVIKREMMLRENEVFQLQVKNQAKLYQSISENFDKQKRKTHEYKNQIICIESLLKNKEYEELQKYVDTLYGHLNKELDAIDTNNVIVNAILNVKYEEAVKKGIVFVFKVNDLSNLNIADEDIVTLLSNLLCNAIEACEKCTDKKIIWLKFVKENGTVIISVKNTYAEPICYVNGEIVTSKADNKGEHGIGLKNVIKIIDKYGGSHVIKEEKGTFLFSVII
jgi:hypothetical protein